MLPPLRGLGIGLGKSGGTVQPPQNLLASLIPEGVRLTWTDSTTPNTSVEVEGSVDSGDYSLLATVANGVQLYDDIRDPGVEMTYRIRAKSG